jgi:hypothetical protein
VSSPVPVYVHVWVTPGRREHPGAPARRAADPTPPRPTAIAAPPRSTAGTRNRHPAPGISRPFRSDQSHQGLPLGHCQDRHHPTRPSPGAGTAGAARGHRTARDQGAAHRSPLPARATPIRPSDGSVWRSQRLHHSDRMLALGIVGDAFEEDKRWDHRIVDRASTSRLLRRSCSPVYALCQLGRSVPEPNLSQAHPHGYRFRT